MEFIKGLLNGIWLFVCGDLYMEIAMKHCCSVLMNVSVPKQGSCHSTEA